MTQHDPYVATMRLRALLRAVEGIQTILHGITYCLPSEPTLLGAITARGREMSRVRHRLVAMAEEIEEMRVALDEMFSDEWVAS